MILDHDRARPVEQPPLGLGRRTAAEQDHRRACQPDEQRQAVEAHRVSHSGTRSAARIVSAAMRSATTAKRSPSTNTSGTSARLLRSEEHTSELQSLMRISYAVFCLKKKNHKHQTHTQLIT